MLKQKTRLPAFFVFVALSLALSATATAQDVTLAPASLSWNTVEVGQTSGIKSFTVTNNQSVSLTITSISVPAGSDFAVSSTTCPLTPSTLAPAANCTVSAQFRPLAQGTRTSAVTVADNAPSQTQSLPLSGVGVLGAVLFSPTSLSFNNVLVGTTSAVQTATLTNRLSSAITLSNIRVGGKFAQTNDCPISPSTLAGGASCNFSVTFSPTVSGPSNSSVTVTYNTGTATASPQLYLSGTTSQNFVTLTPTSYNFGSVQVNTASPGASFTLTNSYSQPVAISSISTKLSDYAASSNCPTSPSTLSPSATCSVTVKFTPAASGVRSDTLTVTHNAPGSTTAASLTGTGTSSGGSVNVSPKTYTFPDQATGTTSAPQTITLTNGQSVALAISSIQISPPFNQTNNCGSSVPAGTSCAITVTYAPTAVGFTSTNLVITDDAAGSPQNVAIAGNAIAAVSVTPKVGGLTFFHQIVQTTSSPLPVTLTNNQSVALTINSITSTADFPFTTSCVGSSGTGTLAPQASCTIQVSFDPQAIGSRSATLTVAESAYGSPITVPLAGTGIAGDPGLTVTVEPTAPCALPSQNQQFTAALTGTSNTSVRWYVDNVPNGNGTVGTISAAGLYTAPATQGTHTVTAVSQASTKISGNTTVTVTATPVFAIYPFTSSLLPSGQQTFQPQICYVPDSGPVSWSVDNIAGGNSAVGTVTNTGVYTAPATAGKHTVRVTDLSLNKTSGGVVTVYSNVSVDFGSRTTTAHPVPTNLFGSGRGESIQSTADRALLTQAGVTTSRLYAQIPLVYATQTPDWTKIDPLIASVQAAGQHVMLQMSYTPPWLQPNPNPCGTGGTTVPPTDVSKWGQLAASYVAHMDVAFPGVVQDYEIWNEPNASGLCAKDRLNTYMSIYAAAAPLMKQQAAADGVTIRVGGPVLSAYSAIWISTLLSGASTAPYVDFVSYHQYMFGQKNLQVKWDTYNGDTSLYQQTQDPNSGPSSVYNKVHTQVAAGKQPLGANTPIYVTEFNTNWAFYQDCCRNDPTYAPLWNALYISDFLNSAYSGLPSVAKLTYFAGSAYPYFCLIGTLDQNMDCSYSAQSTPQPYPQYYTFQLLSSANYLDLVDGGYMATSITPPTGGGGLVVTAFYNASQDAIVIVNPTGTTYSQLPVTLQNVGFGTPQATLYQIVNGASINSSSLVLQPQGANYSANVDVPAYSVQAISLKGQ